MQIDSRLFQMFHRSVSDSARRESFSFNNNSSWAKKKRRFKIPRRRTLLTVSHILQDTPRLSAFITGKAPLRWSNGSNFGARPARGFITAGRRVYARENRRDNAAPVSRKLYF